ncbi:hypothetical protein G7054_g9076 [Neopestalotiopsis clavispora]|nr:hypothetical protein G7054_g9076 [Neopestalotiopsis clavispora]
MSRDILKAASATFVADPTVQEVEDTNQSAPKSHASANITGDAKLLDDQGRIRRIPIPSQSPNDPLNFRIWWKIACIGSCCWFSVMSLALVGSIGMILNAFFEEYIPAGHSSAEILYLVTAPSLSVGLASIGAAFTQSLESHLAARVVQGLAAGATESLLPLMLAEVTFIHQRPMVYAVYWGYQRLGGDESWYYGLFSIVAGLGAIFATLFGFETRFSRPPTSLVGQIIVTDTFGVTRVLDEQEAENYQKHQPQQNHSEEIESPKSYLQMLKIWPGVLPEGGKVVVMSYVHMAQCLTSPAILYCIFVFSITLGLSIALSLTQDTVFHNLYGWPEYSVGLLNVGCPIVTCVAVLYSGWLSTKVDMYLAKRCDGTHKPEHRLVLLILPGMVGILGTMLYAAAAETPSRFQWFAPYMGWTFFQFSFITVSATLSTFATEAWPRHPGPALVMVVGVKNIVGFAVANSIQLMINLHGYLWGYGMLTAIFGTLFLLGIPVYYLNPKTSGENSSRNNLKLMSDV